MAKGGPLIGTIKSGNLGVSDRPRQGSALVRDLLGGGLSPAAEGSLTSPSHSARGTGRALTQRDGEEAPANTHHESHDEQCLSPLLAQSRPTR
jgi:hypothetical protein